MKKAQILNGNKLVSDILTRRKNKPKIKNLQLVKEYQEKTKEKESFSKKIAYTSPKKISHSFNKDENFDNECQEYYKLMKKHKYTTQRKMNSYITESTQWDLFPNIRAKNKYGNMTETIPGISRKAYREICNLMKKQISSNGQPLSYSEKY